ncbi:dmX-like protein 2 isoform X2 [Halichondria panicea]|uniref:dmX-like protein 2 isoform X2 n=1 Tax=Halichondria panicea TaxID=6063 RepID=UPI00312BB1BA
MEEERGWSAENGPPHPTLAYYLTGCMDGSVVMWEFGNPRPVSTQIPPGFGASVTMIRFTPEGNKYGVTDNSGKLSLWQGIHTAARKPYHSLYSGMKHLSDFLFLGSSSFIATCGDGSDNRHVFLWDTLLPAKLSVVKEFVCHESGVVSLGYLRAKQRLFCGDRRGEVLIFDLRQMCLLQSLTVHSSAVNRIVVDDIDGFIATGSADGDIKVLDSNSFEELASYPGLHAKSRLFRQTEGGITDLGILPGGRLYSCDADSSVKCQTVVL